MLQSLLRIARNILFIVVLLVVTLAAAALALAAGFLGVVLGAAAAVGSLAFQLGHKSVIEGVKEYTSR
jgi:hypothetical protein